MRIKRVRLKNGYKRFHDLTIDLGESPARIIALVGPNGCGKSSVLDGLLYRSRQYRVIGSGNRQSDNYHSMKGTETYQASNIEIDFVEGTFDQVAGPQLAKGNATAFSFRSPYRYNTVLNVSQTKATTKLEANDMGASDAGTIDSRIEENYRRLYAQLNDYMEQHNVGPATARAKLIGELNRSLVNCLDLEIANVGNIEKSMGTIYFHKPDHAEHFSFNVLSSGEKEVVDLILDLYLRKDIYRNTVFLFDEPELHINTAIQGRLLDEIDRLIGPDCQIWLTTHSIGFLRALQNRKTKDFQIVQFKPGTKFASEPVVLTPAPITRALWRELFSVALDDLVDLISPRVIVYCEGRADPGKAGLERGMDAQVFNAIFSGSRPDAHFVSSGGNTELDQRSEIAISIIGKVFQNVEILVLKDRDMASGRATGEKERQLYLKVNGKNHRVLNRWEIENYLFDKEVLRIYCQREGLEFNEAKYDAVITDIVDADVKKEISAVKASCSVVVSVSPEVFKIELAKCVPEAPTVFKELEDCIFNRI